MGVKGNKQKGPSQGKEGRPPQSLKSVETVRAEGSWCCLARSSSLPSTPSTPSQLKPKVLRKLGSEEASLKENHQNVGNSANAVTADTAQEAIYRKLERKKRSGELNRAGEVLKNGEIAALLKQGFIAGSGTLEKGSGSPFKIRVSPGRVSPLVDVSSSPTSPPSATTFAKLNSLLSTGFLSQSSPPPAEKARSSPTLFEMMVHEQELQEKAAHYSGPQLSSHLKQASMRHVSLQDRISSLSSPGSQFNDAASSDVKLTLTSSTDGISVTVHVHSEVLAAQSRFFAAKFSDRWSKQPQQIPHAVHISNCNDVEAYIDTLRLMYCQDVKRKLLKESVSRVLNILKVSASIFFETGIISCLEYLEAVPWAEEEEEKVTTLLAKLQLESIGTGEVLKRVSTEDSTGSQDLLVRLLHLVIKGTDEKARREMKGLVSKMLRENAAQGKDHDDLSKDSIYQSCQDCLESLLHLFSQAANPDAGRMNEDRCMLMTNITRHADNLNWLVDILIDRQIADDFVRMWAFQAELATLHGQVPIALGRYEVSRLTARLCMAIGKGQVLAAKEIRFALLQNWLQPLIDDFGWMQRACKGLDRGLVEEGISQTILTLPLKQQQTIMVAWFDRFLKNGDDCPNLQRAFETWWRRTFLRPQLDACPSSPAKECHQTPIQNTTLGAAPNEVPLVNPSSVVAALALEATSQTLPE